MSERTQSAIMEVPTSKAVKKAGKLTKATSTLKAAEKKNLAAQKALARANKDAEKALAALQKAQARVEKVGAS